MILANTRARLTREDAHLVLQLLSEDGDPDRARETREQALEATLREDGLDPLLDDPALPKALLSSPAGARASWPLFGYVMVRHALRAVGEGDRQLADYVASVLLHFGLRRRAHQLAEHDDDTHDSLWTLVAELESGDARRAFLARTHLGNYALWLSGLFPDHIEQRRWRRGGPDLGYFEEMGQRGFRLAADHRLANEHGLAPLFMAASERFPRLRVALNHVSDRLLFPQVHTPERLMRQVRDMMM